MNVLQVNTVEKSGGAALAMYRLSRQLANDGHISRILVGLSPGRESECAFIDDEALPFRGLKDKIADRIGTVLNRTWGFDRWSHPNSWHVPETTPVRNADLVNLHNLHGDYFNFRALPRLTQAKPVVWTLHDMWALTGHCAYSYDCGRWQGGCHDCPLLLESAQTIVEPPPTPVDRTRSVWEMKRRLYRRITLDAVTPSRWLKRLAETSILASAAATVQCIPNGIDLDVFKPMDGRSAKAALGLSPDKRVIFFSAASTQHDRKGFDHLLCVLQRLPKDRDLSLLSSGRATPNGLPPTPFPHTHLGYLESENLQRLAYCAADLFVFPTLADNQPLVVLEALACGTPVVSFDVGGVGEMVRHMETGYLARPQDIEDMLKGIMTLIDNDDLRKRMQERSREVALAEYSLSLQSRRYAEVYGAAIERFRSVHHDDLQEEAG